MRLTVFVASNAGRFNTGSENEHYELVGSSSALGDGYTAFVITEERTPIFYYLMMLIRIYSTRILSLKIWMELLITKNRGL